MDTSQRRPAGVNCWLFDRDEQIFVPDYEYTALPDGAHLIFCRGYPTTAAVSFHEHEDDSGPIASGWISLHKLGYRDMDHAQSGEQPEALLPLGNGAMLHVPGTYEDCAYLRILNKYGVEVLQIYAVDINPNTVFREIACAIHMAQQQ